MASCIVYCAHVYCFMCDFLQLYSPVFVLCHLVSLLRTVGLISLPAFECESVLLHMYNTYTPMSYQPLHYSEHLVYQLTKYMEVCTIIL